MGFVSSEKITADQKKSSILPREAPSSGSLMKMAEFSEEPLGFDLAALVLKGERDIPPNVN